MYVIYDLNVIFFILFDLALAAVVEWIGLLLRLSKSKKVTQKVSSEVIEAQRLS